jgi:hypothetical protein
MAQDFPAGYSQYGTPGLIDMPTALAFPDAQTSLTLGGIEQQQRLTFTFQISPRLTGALRYSYFSDFSGPGTDDRRDRSLDLQYQLLTETDRRPAVAIGFRDFLGTGLFTSEYVVATKSVGSDLRVTGGIGWGRMATEGGFTNPLGVLDPALETRPPLDFGAGGTLALDQYFRGDAAFFGGVEWQVRDDLTLVAEYSSDRYPRETSLDVLDHRSPLNFGLHYRPRPGYELSAHYIMGSQLGFAVTLLTDPKTRSAPSGLDPAPIPVAVRSGDARAARSWDRTATPPDALVADIKRVLALDGFEVSAVDVSDRAARLRYTNTTYRTEAQGLGRVARVLTHTLPASIETFTLEPMQAGIPLSAVVIRRSDLEALENEPDAAWRSLARARIEEAGGDAGLVAAPETRSPFAWGISPYLELALFDRNNPVRGDFGIQASAEYHFQPNLLVSGTVRYRLAGNRTDTAVHPRTPIVVCPSAT